MKRVDRDLDVIRDLLIMLAAAAIVIETAAQLLMHFGFLPRGI